jgi:hypothetical protein
MFWTPRSSPLLALSILVGCATGRYEPTAVSSADGAGYAIDYVEQLRKSRDAFAQDERRALDLNEAIRSHTASLAPSLQQPDAQATLQRVIEQSDRSGRGMHYAAARDEERALRGMWDEERGALGARVTSAVHKETIDAGCKDVDVQPAVQHALRDGFDKQLERRTRAANEGQRTLEQHKARLPQGSLVALQRLSDEVALASHLTHVALVDDLRELDRLLSERRQVDETLARMLDDERAIQRDPKKPSEQKASQERVVKIDQQRAALAPELEQADTELRSLEQRQRSAQADYEAMLAAVQDSLRRPPETGLPGQEIGSR